MFVLLFGPSLGHSTASSTQFICELLMTGHQLRAAALESFRDEVLERSFSRLELNPHGQLKLFEIPFFKDFRQGQTRLRVSQSDAASAFVMNFETGSKEWELKGRVLNPIIHWVVADVPPHQFQNILQESGGVLHEREVLSNLEGKIAKGGVRTGVILTELPAGGRAFMSFGYNAARTFELIFGLDVPCEQADQFAQPQPERKYYSEWKVFKVISEDGVFCRIPAAISILLMPVAAGFKAKHTAC